MAKLKGPIEIYREALAEAPIQHEEHPPIIERAEVWPYPDLKRLWIRLSTSTFGDFPNLALTITDPDGQIACTMFMVEIRERYQSITLHLRREPQPEQPYRLELILLRDEQVLDTKVVDFALTFRDPGEEKPSHD
jgi:hypothetical protein